MRKMRGSLSWFGTENGEREQDLQDLIGLRAMKLVLHDQASVRPHS